MFLFKDQTFAIHTFQWAIGYGPAIILPIKLHILLIQYLHGDECGICKMKVAQSIAFTIECKTTTRIFITLNPNGLAKILLKVTRKLN